MWENCSADSERRREENGLIEPAALKMNGAPVMNVNAPRLWAAIFLGCLSSLFEERKCRKMNGACLLCFAFLSAQSGGGGDGSSSSSSKSCFASRNSAADDDADAAGVQSAKN